MGPTEVTNPAGLIVNGPAGGGRSAASIRRAELEGGWVSLLPLDHLQAVVADLERTTKDLRGESSNIAGKAAGPLGQAGVMLANQWQQWPSGPFYDLIRRMIWLQVQDHDLSGQIADLRNRQYKGLSGIAQRIKDRGQAAEVERQVVPVAGELRELSLQLAQAATPTQIQEIEKVRGPAMALLQRSHELAGEADQNAEVAATLSEEVSRRHETVSQLGFDALYLAAKAETDGLDPVDSPLITRRGEQAYFVSPARLARMSRSTRYVGGSQGFSFPIGRTGIRYRVGSYSGRPVQTQSLTTVDSGSIVISNQRFAFLGRQKSVAFPLAKILQVQGYRDGVAVSREGRENADFFQDIQRVGEMLFYINWFLRDGG